jgi:aerobic carbon-monoxide dehydrogenase small subunit
MKRYSIQFKVNGTIVNTEVSSSSTLLQVLRRLGHTEVKNGCEKGDCGSCAVVLDGKVVNSCLVLAVQADGAEIMTVRGLGGLRDLHPLQQNFIDHGAVQCGYCTPGMILAADALLKTNSDPSREEIIDGISGNLCRCTGYTKIVEAIESTAKDIKETR